MIFRKMSPRIKTRMTGCLALKKQAWAGTLVVLALVSLSGCDRQARADGEVGPPLVKVNDVEITMLQPADELAPAEGRPTATKEAADKQKLEMVIDRQLLQDEAMRNKLDREPQVIQAIDSAKAQILAEAYLQTKFASIATPSRTEVDAYFRAHPELFTERKVFYMKELMIATKDFSAQLKARLDSAKSIGQVALWLDKNHVQYKRAQLSRSTADLAPEMIKRLQTMRRNQLFVVKAGEYTMLDSIYEVKPSPVTAEEAAQQIGLYLRNKKRKEIGDAELERLRASAKVEYLNKKQLASATAPAARLAGSPATIQIEDGITGRK